MKPALGQWGRSKNGTGDERGLEEKRRARPLVFSPKPSLSPAPFYDRPQ